MKILVTGGAGYIGSHTVMMLQKAGFETLILDNLAYGHREFVEDTELIIGDMGDPTLLENIFTQHCIDGVIHFAAYAYVGESVADPLKYYRNNFCGTLTLLEMMTKFNIKHIIFSSTCATYGVPLSPGLIAEDHPQNPINPYGQSKLMVEHCLKDLARVTGLTYMVLRYFNAAGADPEARLGEDHNPEAHLIPLVLDVALGKRTHINVFGQDYPTPDGTCVRDYIHVNDLAQAHVLGLQHLLSGGHSHALNLGNGLGFSVLEVIHMVESITGKTIPIHIEERRLGDPPTLVGSSEQAKRILGWEPEFTSLESIITTAWQWHKKRFGN